MTFAAPEAVERCVHFLQRQTFALDAILVVDNDSPIPPRESLICLIGEAPVQVMQLRENLGPAGGYAAAFSGTLESTYDYLWVMDDDCMPAHDCLELLLCEMVRRDG